MIGIELEVLAKKFDRFGWDRDRGGMAHDRMIIDWMDALHDFPLVEIKAACVAAVLNNPNKMPNEGHIRERVITARAKMIIPQQAPPEPKAKQKYDPAQIIKEVAANNSTGDKYYE